jgi:predicted ATPase
VELLEREAALAALGDARASAAGGRGRVACVSGEPGIGKSSLVRRFADDVDGAGRVLLGSCDNLAIPRPLGPFRDLTGSVSPELDEALRAGAAPHELQALLLTELELPPRPAVLVIEDVHWADDATLDSIAVLSRRIADLHALLVMTFRGGEAPPAHPLHAALSAIRAEDLVTIELEPF